jgi:hypothetical protein
VATGATAQTKARRRPHLTECLAQVDERRICEQPYKEARIFRLTLCPINPGAAVVGAAGHLSTGARIYVDGLRSEYRGISYAEQTLDLQALMAVMEESGGARREARSGGVAPRRAPGMRQSARMSCRRSRREGARSSCDNREARVRGEGGAPRPGRPNAACAAWAVPAEVGRR